MTRHSHTVPLSPSTLFVAEGHLCSNQAGWCHLRALEHSHHHVLSSDNPGAARRRKVSMFSVNYYSLLHRRKSLKEKGSYRRKETQNLTDTLSFFTQPENKVHREDYLNTCELLLYNCLQFCFLLSGINSQHETKTSNTQHPTNTR